jgi:valyl-tRNA synthetase
MNHNHELEEIYRVQGFFGVDAVVMWCPTCGCVVIDEEEVDNRTSPGAIMKMRFPHSK